jgi:hypothetical protein
MATGAVIARILSQYSDKGSKAAQKDLAKLTKKFDQMGKKALKATGLAAVATAGLAVKLGKDAVQGAMEDQKAQASLATALRNTTGATQEAIAANAAFLDSLELQVAIDNEELIPALKTLVQGTGNLSRAQGLLSLATDISAASGKDLGAVSMALSKAYNGQFGALTKLGLPLSAATVKAKDFTKAQEELAAITKGQAEAAANTFAGKLITLRLRFNQVADRVGYALIPVLEKLVDRLENDVFPAFDKFIRMNQNDIVDAFAGTIALAEKAVRAFIKIAEVLKTLQPLLMVLGSGILAIVGYAKLLSVTLTLQGFLQFLSGATKEFTKNVMGLGTAAGKTSGEFIVLGLDMKKLGTGMQGLKSAPTIMNKMTIAASAFWLAMSPASKFLLVIGALIAAFTLLWKGLGRLSDKFVRDDRKRAAQRKIELEKEKQSIQNLGMTMVNYAEQVKRSQTQMSSSAASHLADLNRLTDAMKDAQKQARIDAQDAARNARLQAEQLADEQKRLYIQGLEKKGAQKLLTLNRTLLTDKKKMEVQLAAIKAKNAKLDKAGIKLTDPDEMTAIQMEAIYQNLLKNGKVLLAETTKQQKALDELKQKAAEEYNKTLLRQADIVQHLDKLRANDIVVIGYLANKWEMTTEAADMYIKSVLAIGEVKMDDSGILAIRMAWGMSGDQAKKYLEFTAAIKEGHGNIGKEKLEELGRKWFKDSDNPYDAALKYSQALTVLADQQVGADEVKALAEAWNITPDAVAAYLLEVGKPFTLTDDAKLILSADMVSKIAGQWDKARLALIAYLNAAKGFTFPNPNGTPNAGNPNITGCPAGSTMVNGKCVPITTPNPTDSSGLGGSKTDSAAASAASAIAYAVAKATGDMDAAAKAAAGVTPSALASQESGAIGAASIARQLADAENQVRIASSLAAFKAKEAADLAASQASARTMDYDERFRFRSFSAPTADAPPAPSPTPKTSDLKITIDATGDELSTAIRNSLLFSQSNGSQITLQAI